METEGLLAFELMDIPDSFIKLLRQNLVKGVDLIEIDQRLFLCPISLKLMDLLSKTVYEYDKDTGAFQVKLVLVNQDHTLVNDGDPVIQEIEKKANVTVIDERIIFDEVNSLIKYIVDNYDEEDNETNNLETNDDFDDASSIDAEFEKTFENFPNEDVDTDDIQEEAVVQESESASNGSEEYIEETDDKQSENTQVSNNQDLHGHHQTYVDEENNITATLYQAATDILDKNFPDINFDELDISSSMQLDVTIAKNDNSQIKLNLLNQIYQKLIDQQNVIWNSMQQNELSQIKSETIEKINQYQQKSIEDKDRIHSDYLDRYNAARDEYVRSQAEFLKSQYDSKNRATMLNDVQQKQSEIDNQFTFNVQNIQHQEGEQIAYLQQQSIDQTVSNVDLAFELQQYSEQQADIKNQLVGSIDTTNQEIVQYQEKIANLKKEISELQDQLLEERRNLKNFKSTNEERLKSGIDKEVAVQVGLLSEKHHQNIEAIQEQKQKQLEDKQRLIDDLKDKEVTLQKELDNKIKDLKSKDDVISHQKTLLNQSVQPQQPMIIKDQATAPNPNFALQQNQQKDRIPYYLSGMAIIVTLIIGFASIWTSKQQVNSGSNQLPQQTQVEQKPDSTRDDSSHSFKEGDVFTYTTDEGNKVKVHVDDKHSGHYVDSEGHTHTVTF